MEDRYFRQIEIKFSGGDTMELLEAIYNRRAVRAFRPDQIADEVLNKILEAGTWAPSHGNNQPWEFIIIGQETLDKLQKVYS